MIHSDDDNNEENIGEIKNKVNLSTGNVIKEQTEVIKEGKKRKMIRPFNEDLLIGNDGITRIYDEFPRACQLKGRGNEAQDAKRIVTMYKEWAFQLHPGFSFSDILLKSEALGPKAKVKVFMETLRSKERERYLLSIAVQSKRHGPQRTQANTQPSAIPIVTEENAAEEGLLVDVSGLIEAEASNRDGEVILEDEDEDGDGEP